MTKFRPPPDVEDFVKRFVPILEEAPADFNIMISVRRDNDGATATLTVCRDTKGVLITVAGMLRNTESICRDRDEDGSANFLSAVCGHLERMLGVAEIPENRGVEAVIPPSKLN